MQSTKSSGNLEKHKNISPQNETGGVCGKAVIQQTKIRTVPLPQSRRMGGKMPKVGRHQMTCRIPGRHLNVGNFNVRVLLVENGTRANVILEDVIGFDVKDLIPRKAGAWHGREPGPVRPKLGWIANALK